ncbi:Protein kinase domain [Macleaya cordata]|uniref:non-specific serine/threonine protein kinase n=1 Tax=Macleaya cordata TaxID=56857 RepID=A0A200PWT0_MACCD|nr:Protein kinase domain [Macleaya cordata]
MNGNKLTGQIPSSIGNLSLLNRLYLGGNDLSGTVPYSLGAAITATFKKQSSRGIQEIDLSSNNLSGQIPRYLETVPFLEKLNLSFNNLEDEVPEEGIFRNASAISILVLIFGVFYRKRKYENIYSYTSSLEDTNVTVSYRGLLKSTDGFSMENLIGKGIYGSVYKATLDQVKRIVAVKVLDVKKQGASKSFMAECKALRNVRHRNHIKLLTSCSSLDFKGNEFKALVFEFMPNGNLEDWLHPPREDDQHKFRNLKMLERLNIALDVASALDYLHNHCPTPIIHCDLKPSNVLLDDDMTAHAGDFGSARFLIEIVGNSHQSTSTAGIKGTVGYVAPEYGMDGDVSTYGDVYSYGILLLELFTGRRPTDDMFKDGLNLHEFAKMAFLDRVMTIVDPKLLLEEEKMKSTDS